MKSIRHEPHYTIFCISLFLPPSHIKYSPHRPAFTHPPSSSLDRTPTFTPTQNDRNNVSFTDQFLQHSELKSDKYCLHLSCYSSKIIILTVCQDLTYLKPDLQQSDSGTSQAMWHKILTALDFTIRTAQNPLSTVQIRHEYRLPQKPHIPNIC